MYEASVHQHKYVDTGGMVLRSSTVRNCICVCAIVNMG